MRFRDLSEGVGVVQHELPNMLHSSLDDNRPKTKFDFKFRKLEKKGSAVFETFAVDCLSFQKEEQTMLFLLDLEEKNTRSV